VKYLFIVNPVAGGRKNKYEKIIAEAEVLMQEIGAKYEIYLTKGPMDATRKIEADSKIETELRVIACGGDGTLNECVNGSVGLKNVALTNYPCGTGNDFIKMFGVERKRFLNLSELIHGETRPLDIIKCNERYCINICSVGIDARVGIDVHKYSKLPLLGGKFAYVVSLIINFFKGINRYMCIKTDSMEEAGEFALVCICNGRYYGGGFNPARNAMPNDGILDFIIVNEVSRLRFIKFVGYYAKGKLDKAAGIVRRIVGEKIDICGNEDFKINVDGEAILAKSAHISIVKKGINFIFPKDMKFFRAEA
jgi:diacylglycerol kinase (ATP)